MFLEHNQSYYLLKTYAKVGNPIHKLQDLTEGAPMYQSEKKKMLAFIEKTEKLLEDMLKRLAKIKKEVESADEID